MISQLHDHVRDAWTRDQGVRGGVPPASARADARAHAGICVGTVWDGNSNEHAFACCFTLMSHKKFFVGVNPSCGRLLALARCRRGGSPRASPRAASSPRDALAMPHPGKRNDSARVMSRSIFFCFTRLCENGTPTEELDRAWEEVQLSVAKGGSNIGGHADVADACFVLASSPPSSPSGHHYVTGQPTPRPRWRRRSTAPRATAAARLLQQALQLHPRPLQSSSGASTAPGPRMSTLGWSTTTTLGTTSVRPPAR